MCYFQDGFKPCNASVDEFVCLVILGLAIQEKLHITVRLEDNGMIALRVRISKNP